MEKVMSTEDKIRRAEEIYNKRKQNQASTYTTKVNINEKRNIKLLKKVFIQIIICFAIYSVVYVIKNNNYIFTEDFLSKTKEILNYDINFQEIYLKITEILQKQEITNQEENLQENEENIEKEEKQEEQQETENEEQNAIGGAEEGLENTREISQMEQDALEIKNSISFINPIEGTITSEFGWRNPSSSTVPKYHTGLDIANVSGTVIHSSTAGNAILVSSTGDYRQSY